MRQDSSVRPVVGHDPMLSIGEVLAELRADFPDTTISKLRFLETEGLVDPQRTPSGYRQYSRADVARLRYVLTAQRDHYLPLKVIRENLATIDQGLPPPRVQVPSQLTPLPSETSAATTPGATFSRDELAQKAGIDDKQLAHIEQFALLTPHNDGRYTEEDVIIASAAAQLSQYGIEPRHLRPYKAAAERELGLFTQVLAPLSRSRDSGQLPLARGDDTRTRITHTASHLADLSLQLHAALVRAGLRAMVENTLDLKMHVSPALTTHQGV